MMWELSHIGSALHFGDARPS